MKAKKIMPGTSLNTATSASHPESPDQVGARTMSGRSAAKVSPTMGKNPGNLGGGSLPRKLAPANIGKAKNSTGY